MNLDDENGYRSCRLTAGLTQEAAAEMLEIGTRTLSDYENGHTPVSSEMVLRMMDAYNAPALGYWHISNIDPLGKVCLGKSPHSPRTNGELAFRSISESKRLKKSSKVIARIMANEQVNEDELLEFYEWLDCQERVANQLLSNVAYGKELVRDRSRPVGEKKKKKRTACVS